MFVTKNMRNFIVVDDASKVDFCIANAEIISAKEYLTKYHPLKRDSARVYNLCKSYKYQSDGYYVSLLALARGHKVLPSITTIQDLKSQAMIKFCNNSLKNSIEKSLAKIQSDSFVLSIYFGKNIAKQHSRLCKQIFEMFRAPLLRATFDHKKKGWQLTGIKVIALDDVPENHTVFFRESARCYFQQRRYSKPYKKNAIYDLGILVDNNEADPPSDPEAINRFVHAAEALGFCADIIGKDDFRRVSEYDALFIRVTTAVNHYTYRFARQAFAENLVVIDDPDSIIKCTNKVYIAELLRRAKVATPHTLVISKGNAEIISRHIGFPCVLKEPDSSFSRGVVKASNEVALRKNLNSYFSSSELIIAQEFMRTDFDWRIGVLDRRAIFACKYYMAENHWQIYNWNEQNDRCYGDYEAVDMRSVPDNVIAIALKAANLIGDGFYGVDIKEYKGHAYVIEINDNPSVDAGVEDQFLGDELYLTIMRTILRRIHSKKGIVNG